MAATELKSIGWVLWDVEKDEPLHPTRPGYHRGLRQPPRIYPSARRALAYGTHAVEVFVMEPQEWTTPP